MALMPEQTLWSATAAVEPSASLACVIALLFAAEFRESKRTAALAATAVATAYAVQFRAESAVIVPVVGLMVLSGFSKDELGRPRFWAVGLLALVLVSIHLGHLVAVRNEPWGTTDARLSFHYVVTNLRANGWFYLRDERFPVLFTILAGAGLVTGRRLAPRLVFAAYFASFFAVYLLFYAGSYNYGADVRYSLMTFPPVAVLSGLGVSRLVSSRGSVPRILRTAGDLARDGSSGVSVVVVRAARARDDGRSLGGSGGCDVRRVFRSRTGTARLRVDSQSGDVPRVGHQCRTAVQYRHQSRPAGLSGAAVSRGLFALELLVQRAGRGSAIVLRSGDRR